MENKEILEKNIQILKKKLRKCNGEKIQIVEKIQRKNIQWKKQWEKKILKKINSGKENRDSEKRIVEKKIVEKKIEIVKNIQRQYKNICIEKNITIVKKNRNIFKKRQWKENIVKKLWKKIQIVEKKRY